MHLPCCVWWSGDLQASVPSFHCVVLGNGLSPPSFVAGTYTHQGTSLVDPSPSLYLSFFICRTEQA